MSSSLSENEKKAQQATSLDTMIVATTYVQSLTSTASIVCFIGCAILYYFSFKATLTLFVAGFLFALLYWSIDSWLGEFRCSGVTNRMKIIALTKRVAFLEKQ